jgi:hypothetical protein
MRAKGTSGGVTVIAVDQLLAAAAASRCRKDALPAHAGLRRAAPDKSLSFQNTASFASAQSLWKVA